MSSDNDSELFTFKLTAIRIANHYGTNMSLRISISTLINTTMPFPDRSEKEFATAIAPYAPSDAFPVVLGGYEHCAASINTVSRMLASLLHLSP
jgi:hypothetical protein